MFLGSDKLQVLYEQWLSCDGHWTESAIYQQLKTSSRHRKKGARKWLTEAELALKYGSAVVAAKITLHKRSEPECKDQVREHKDCPGDPESCPSISMSRLDAKTKQQFYETIIRLWN